MPEPLLTASAMFANAARFSDAYHAALSPLCAETGLPPAAADILLFLANNPGCETAGAICRMRGLKPAIVYFHIDRLVGEGFLLRQPVPGDRRKTALVLSEKAACRCAGPQAAKGVCRQADRGPERGRSGTLPPLRGSL